MILASLSGSGEPLFSAEPGERPGLYHLRGELDISTAPQLAAILDKEQAADRSVALDMSDVSFIDSQGIRVLLTFASRERPLTIVSPSERVRRVLEIALPGDTPGLVIRAET